MTGPERRRRLTPEQIEKEQMQFFSEQHWHLIACCHNCDYAEVHNSWNSVDCKLSVPLGNYIPAQGGDNICGKYHRTS